MRTRSQTFLAVAAIALPLLLAGCRTAPPPIPFSDYKAPYATKPDFARVELDHPLSAADRAKITPANLRVLPQEKVDQIYARLTAGPIPDGPYTGDLFFADGGGLERISDLLGKAGGFANDLALDELRLVVRVLWKGKVFYRDKRELRNMIDHEAEVAKLFDVKVSDFRTGEFNGRKVALLFPAKLFCGQSNLDSRRESVIIDYAFGDDVDGYIPKADSVAGRNGLQVRDEIRMVRPGFYLGRAYMGKLFILNFTLYNEAAAKAGNATEDCWNGKDNPESQQVADVH
ncbi:MAG TPA: hypothetical protein VH988_21975 [Thermoanaerobaculia bacterium]|jgi:hypothetical protein|nr:hypothetical protein [Thermoanaerobaculia bacterium]